MMNLKFNIKELKIKIKPNILKKFNHYAQTKNGPERGGVLIGKLYIKSNIVLN